MSEDTPDTPARPSTPELSAQSEQPATASSTFWSTVKDKIAAHGAAVGEKVVDLYANKEIDDRVQRTVAAVAALQELEGKLRKIKPDNIRYDLAGKEIDSSYSKQTVEERKKLLEQAEKIEAALADVFAETPNFDKLKKLKLKGEKADGSDEQAA